MRKTIIIEVGGVGCDVWVYEDHIMRDIEKAIDLDEVLIQQETKISRDNAADIVKTA